MPMPNIKNRSNLIYLSLFCSMLLLGPTACVSESEPTTSTTSDDSSSTDTDSDTDSETSTVPTVDAGSDQSVTGGETVLLSATVVDDGDYTLTWAQISGINVSLADVSNDNTAFTAPDESSTLVFIATANDGTSSVSDTVSITITSTSGESDTSAWIVNETGEVSEHILDSTTGNGVEVNVQSVTEESVDGKDYVVVTSQGIPNYETTITQDILDGLTDRPKADSDFVSTAPTVAVGDVVSFGEDVGYESNSNCTTDYGYGYWPPGPECPTEDERTVYLPVVPTATTEVCENGLSKIGIMVNGVSIYNWGDGQSYNGEGTWQNLAPVAELYDVDVCGGHAAGTDYHHHFYSACLAELLNDDGSKHSPLYGYAADGYPIYGPYEANGELAISSWSLRDYSATSATGCSDGERSCTLVDQHDISQGTEESNDGAGFDEEVTSLSSNTFTATNGYFYEDHYWNSTLTALGGNYLDQHNGHTSDALGYHYHITLTKDDDGKITPAFPYIIGPRFAGELEDNSVASCSTGEANGPGGQAGPPPG